MSYDRWDWHVDSVLEAGLPDEAAATHIGMYVAWCHSAGLLGEFHYEEFPEAVEELANRAKTPGVWFLESCDGKFWDEDLNEEGNRFAKAYYEGDGINYVDDYIDVFDSEMKARFGDDWSVFAVPDTWESLEKLKPVLDKRLTEWREKSK